MKANEFLKFLNDSEVKFFNFRFTDLLGTSKQITRTVSSLDEHVLMNGITIDGGLIHANQYLKHSGLELLLIPDLNSFFSEPYTSFNTITVLCNIVDINNNTYLYESRLIACNAENALKDLKLADKVFFSTEIEFFIFDSVSFSDSETHSYWKINSTESIEYKSFYGALPPIDTLFDLRSEILMNLEKIPNIEPSISHCELGNRQSRIGFNHSCPQAAADKVQIVKHIIKNTADTFGKSASFMPKISHNSVGNGMHYSISLMNSDQENLFHGNDHMNASKIALHFMAGIENHIKAICAFTNQTINSYKRLSALCKDSLPNTYFSNNVYVNSKSLIKCHFPDALCNPYLAFSAILMAGIDGIINKLDLSSATNESVLPKCLNEALYALQNDHSFLIRNNVFDKRTIEQFVKMKHEEINELNNFISPAEYIKYFSL